MIIVCGKCGITFQRRILAGRDLSAVEQMKAHSCDIHKYPLLRPLAELEAKDKA